MNLITRLSAARSVAISEIASGCRELGFEPCFERGLEGTYAFDPAGRKLATVRLVVSKRDVVLRLDLHSDPLRDAMLSRAAKRMAVVA